MPSLCLLHCLKSKAETHMAVACGECHTISSGFSAIYSGVDPESWSKYWAS